MSSGVRHHPKGNENITGLNLVKGLTVPEGAVFALIQPRTQAVYWTHDGTNPSSSNGLQIPALVVLEYDGDLEDILFLEAAASATLHVAYFGP
jgi:hypothetical protein